jgi:hypothetical protein
MLTYLNHNYWSAISIQMFFDSFKQFLVPRLHFFFKILKKKIMRNFVGR